MKPIYKPKGAAAEYGDYAVNIYTGCPHRCYYCFAPQVLHREREVFHSCVEPRKDIVREVRRQLEREQITGQLIHLCFTCDPYPVKYGTATTREVIQVLKEYGNHIQILTKGDGSRDFDLLDGEDWYGVTISCDDPMAETAEPGAVSTAKRLYDLYAAKQKGMRIFLQQKFTPELIVKQNGLPWRRPQPNWNCRQFLDGSMMPTLLSGSHLFQSQLPNIILRSNHHEIQIHR